MTPFHNGRRADAPPVSNGGSAFPANGLFKVIVDYQGVSDVGATLRPSNQTLGNTSNDHFAVDGATDLLPHFEQWSLVRAEVQLDAVGLAHEYR